MVIYVRIIYIYLPTVGINASENFPSVNRLSKHVLPTEELPTTSNRIYSDDFYFDILFIIILLLIDYNIINLIRFYG